MPSTAAFPTISVDCPDHLLKHYEEHGVIICKPCKFAIQPSALASHLLKHQVYRSERRKLLARLSSHELKDPKDVVDPPPLSAPIPELHVYQGSRCLHAGCQYICASEKRMSQHWSDVHGERGSRNVHARQAWLQTFFRGNKIRYFEVSRPLAVSPKARAVSAERAESKHAIEEHSGPPNLSSALDMDSLKYLLHWKECTALTMPRTECETTYFWSTTISHDALQHPFLMGGILGMAALHLAETEPDLMEAQKHYEAMLRYSVASVAEFRKVQDRPDLRNCTALIAYSRLMCIQQCCPRDASTFREPISKSSLRDPTPLYQALCLNRGLLDILLSTQHLVADNSDFKYPKQEIEDLTPLDDPVAALEDASNVAKIPQAMRLKLQHLSAYIAEMLQCCEVGDVLDLQACLDASTALTSAFARAYSSPTPYLHSADLYIGCPHPKTVRAVWSGIESWLRTISDHYVGLCEQGKPVALVIFAHWAMLLHRWRYRYWYFRNLKDGTLHLIEANLDDHMKSWILDLWTIEEIV